MVDAPTQRPTHEDLKHLSREARMQRLREFEEAQLKRLEEMEQRIAEEIDEVEELIEQDEDEEEQRRAQSSSRAEQEESLEERVAAAPAQPGSEQNYDTVQATYARNDDLYATLDNAASTLESLADRREWTAAEQQSYRRAREQVDEAQQLRNQYNLSDGLLNDISAAENALHRLQYRTL